MKTRESWLFRVSLCLSATAVLASLCFPAPASASTVVDLAVGQVAPAGPLKNGACNTVEVRIRNDSNADQVESGRVELYVLDIATKKALWRHAGLTVRGIQAGRTETLTFTKVEVPVPRMVNSVSVAFQARIFTTGWYRSVDNNTRNNQYLSAPDTVLASDKCGGGGGGDEPDPAGSTAAFGEAASIFKHERCTRCHTAATLPPPATMPGSSHPTSYRGSPITPQDCGTCHHFPSSANPVPASGVGAPVPPMNSNRVWRMAPMGMSLDSGMSDGDICRQILRQFTGTTDAEKAAKAVDHVNEDDLVKWAFQPRCAAPGQPAGSASERDETCANLPAAPLGHSRFVTFMRMWADKGGFCPR